MPQALKTETRDVPMLDCRAALAPNSYDAEKRTVTFVASTGSRGLRRSWRGDYFEELEISESAIRMGRLQNAAPFLNSHNGYDISNVLGVVERAWVESGQLMVSVRFSKRDDADLVLQDVADGILQHVSIGYSVMEYQITDKEGELDVYRAVDWEPMEVSLVPMGFDDAAVSRGAEKEEVSQAKITYRVSGPITEKEANMPTEKKDEQARSTEVVAEKVTTGISEEEATRIATDKAAEATGKERTRAYDIRAAVRSAKLGDEFADGLINEGLSVDDARAKIIDAWAEQDPSEDTRGVRTGIDADIIANIREGASNALMHRAMPEVQLTDQGRGFAGMTLLRISEDILTAGGVNVRGMSSHEIATRALSTSDLASIAGSLVNRTLLQGYESAPRTFVGVFRQGTASDFRDINRVRMSGAPALEEVKEGGEFKYGKVTAEKETYSLATYGKILPFTRQTIINDDMDALIRIPSMFGASAANLESDIVWAIVTANAALQDSVALFHADHSNLAGSGGAISVASVGAARAAMRVQTGMEGRIINVTPRHLIVGADKETELDQFLTNIIANTQANAQPTMLRSLNPVVEPRLTGSSWYLAADFNQVDTVEYSYLEGNQGVYIETKQGFDIDGIAIKARHDFAAKAIDYRGLYKNAGA
ncbi:MAG: hypothetical protein ACI9DH_000562 [Halioglobus sp.]|jgi:hypothetical protein